MKIKRVYDPPQKEDGTRILVDRLWPRGLTKQKAAVDLWLKDIAPSTALRKWFNHDPAKWHEFIIRYQDELKNNKKQVSILESELHKEVTLLYASKDDTHNEALVLKEMFEKKSGE
jgi:uncharacterized protein YeaO (DUF488 family)